MPRRLLPLIAVSAVLALAAGTALGKDALKPPPKPGSKAAAEARADAIAKAMRRLDEDVATSERDMNEQHRVFTTAIAGLVFLLDPAGGKGAVHADRIDACAETIGRYVEGAEKAFERAASPGKAPPEHGSYVALRALGLAARDPALKRTADTFGKHVEDLPEGHGSAPHGVFFGAIACVWLGPEARAAFEKQVVPRILAGQDPETGALDCVCRHQFGTSCESFKNGENVSMSMMGGGASWKTWVRAYANALNLFAVLCEKGKLKLLDGLPADAGRAPSDTTPGDPPAMK